MINFDDFLERENKKEKIENRFQIYGKENKIVFQEIKIDKKELIIKEFNINGKNCKIKVYIYGEEDLNNLIKVDYINIILLEIDNKHLINFSYKNIDNNFEKGEFWTIYINPASNNILELNKYKEFPESSDVIEILINEITNDKIIERIFLE
jgi:hypothetical protein